jgi:hypothetical protein
MDAVTALARLGGVASGTTLRQECGAGALRRAVARREIVRASRNRYVLPDAELAVQAAARLHGKASHLSAALIHGWEIAYRPQAPHVTVPRGRNVPAARRSGVVLHWTRTWNGGGFVTDEAQTVLDCARDLPFSEALAVADSSLRHGHVTRADLLERCSSVTGGGSRRIRRVVEHSDPRSANPFESVLRGIVIEAGLQPVPQLALELDGLVYHPDLTDEGRRVVIEGDSWTPHATKEGHERDCARYNSFSSEGWTVLRFTWQQVMLSPSYVRFVLAKVRRGTSERSDPSAEGESAA